MDGTKSPKRIIELDERKVANAAARHEGKCTCHTLKCIGNSIRVSTVCNNCIERQVLDGFGLRMSNLSCLSRRVSTLLGQQTNAATAGCKFAVQSCEQSNSCLNQQMVVPIWSQLEILLHRKWRGLGKAGTGKSYRTLQNSHSGWDWVSRW